MVLKMVYEYVWGLNFIQIWWWIGHDDHRGKKEYERERKMWTNLSLPEKKKSVSGSKTENVEKEK